MKHYEAQEEPIVISKHTIDLFLKERNPSELMALYQFYYYVAKWQSTNKPKATTAYTAKALHWSTKRVQKVKKQLLKMGLVEDAKSVGEDGKIKGWYIYVKFIWSSSHTQEKPPSKKPYGVEKVGTNALSASSINALSAVSENALPSSSLLPGSSSLEPSSREVSVNSSKRVLPIRQINDKNNTSTSTATSASAEPAKSSKKLTFADVKQDFTKFWATYPRKVAKGNAKKAYLRARKEGVSAKTIQDALELHVHLDQWYNPDYIPYPATWLNGERWEDKLIFAQLSERGKNILRDRKRQAKQERNEKGGRTNEKRKGSAEIPEQAKKEAVAQINAIFKRQEEEVAERFRPLTSASRACRSNSD